MQWKSRLSGLFSIAFCIYVILVAIQAMDVMTWVVMIIYVALAIPFLLFARHMHKKDPANWGENLVNPDTVKTDSQ